MPDASADQRIEWDGPLLGSDHEELLAMNVADL
jgi:hypothetical protein